MARTPKPRPLGKPKPRPKLKVSSKKKILKAKSKLFGKYTVTKKAVTALSVNETTGPRTSGRYRGCSVGRDEKGFFVFTHRARCPSYGRPTQIPDSKIAFIRSTG